MYLPGCSGVPGEPGDPGLRRSEGIKRFPGAGEGWKSNSSPFVWGNIGLEIELVTFCMECYRVGTIWVFYRVFYSVFYRFEGWGHTYASVEDQWLRRTLRLRING